MTTTLTERYVAATVRSIPPATQADVRAELEASIADAVESRLEQGEDRGDAERAVLTELGDPAMLAAGYADRLLHLVGPRYYLTWWRLLKLLLIIIPLCAAGGVALGLTLSNAPIGTTISQSVIAAVSAVVHVCFWVTVVFAIFERVGADTGSGWNIDQLPEPRSTGTGQLDLIVGLALLGLTAGAVLWDRFLGFVHVGEETLPFLHPGLWPWIIGLIALHAAFAVALHLRGRWDTGSAVVNTALAVLFVSLVLTALGRGQLVNAEFVAAARIASGVGQDAWRILAILLGFGAAGASAWSIIDGWLKKMRDAR